MVALRAVFDSADDHPGLAALGDQVNKLPHDPAPTTRHARRSLIPRLT